MTAAQAAITDALQHAHPQDAADAVKEVVAREISEVDSALTVRKTTYFNHTHVPDLVAWWGSDDKDCREIYLRFDATDAYLASDIERLEAQQPLFFSLQSRRVLDAPPEVTGALERHRRTMLTGADAIEALTDTPSESYEALIATAIVQSGRGLIDEDEALNARESTTGGVEAALLTDEDRTREAVSTTRRVLNESASQRFDRYLQLLWLAGGGELGRYPGTTSVEFETSAEDTGSLLRLLLRNETIDNDEYWRRLGSMATLRILESLGNVENNANLQKFINVNADRLSVSYASAARQDSELGHSNQSFLWRIAGSRLCLSLAEWVLNFVDDGRSLRGVKRDHPLLSIEEVRRRAVNFPIEAVRLDDESMFITVERKRTSSLTSGATVGQRAEAIGDQARVRTVTVRNGSSITVEFDRLIAGLERGRVPLPQLAEVSVALLTGDTSLNLESLSSGPPEDDQSKRLLG